MVSRFMESRGLKGRFGPETDYIVTRQRVARADAVLVMQSDYPKHRRTSESSPKTKRKGGIGRLTRPPALVIELISPGHEHHDQVVKHGWYAEAGVPHYWILDERRRSLTCYRHTGSKLVLDAKGRGNDVVRPSLFDGLSIALDELWL
jgi:Uma2 family endonuclease